MISLGQPNDFYIALARERAQKRERDHMDQIRKLNDKVYMAAMAGYVGGALDNGSKRQIIYLQREFEQTEFAKQLFSECYGKEDSI